MNSPPFLRVPRSNRDTFNIGTPLPFSAWHQPLTLPPALRSVDNSEWMRNGDYAPNRLEAQTDAAIQVAARKRDQNPENTVGVLSMAGRKGVQLLCPLVSTMQDLGKILAVLHSRDKIRVDGNCDFVASLKVATLALKHRSEKKLRQRVVMFVGSPIEADAKTLEKTGKALKKNGVAVDIISFGDAEVNNEKLEALINGVNKDGNSRLCAIPAGLNLADALRSSEIMSHPEEESNIGNAGGGGGGDAAAGGGGGGGTDDMGIDESLQHTDPELYMALRESWEAARQQAETPAEGADEGAAAAAPETPAAGVEVPAVDASEAADDYGPSATEAAADDLTGPVVDDVMDEDEELRRAIEMSMAEAAGGADEETAAADAAAAPADDAMDEDDEMARALAMSMGAEAEGGGAAGEAEMGDELDPAFLQSVLQGLDPDVDPDAVKKDLEKKD
jgi:26S proteasome regulatory subunit N10